MGRPPRVDEPGSWHHVYNRGIARRTVFETRADLRRFLCELARVVHRGPLEVHAYCLLANHFHLLVRSLEGQLSESMRRVENVYVRWFNRQRRRDGALFRGRFGSKPADSRRYRRILVRYIDKNPVAAGLAPDPYAYRYASARVYAGATPPPWLATAWIREEIAFDRRRGLSPRAAYEAVFGGSDPDDAFLVERRMKHPSRDAVEDPLQLAKPALADWVRANACLADGRAPRAPVLGPRAIDAATAGLAQESIRFGLLHALAGLTLRELAVHTGLSPSSAHRRVVEHRRRLRNDSAYLRDVTDALRTATRRARVRSGRV